MNTKGLKHAKDTGSEARNRGPVLSLHQRCYRHLSVVFNGPHVVEIGSWHVQCRRRAALEELDRVETKRRRSPPLTARPVARLDSVS